MAAFSPETKARVINPAARQNSRAHSLQVAGFLRKGDLSMDGIQRAPAELTKGTSDLRDRHLSDHPSSVGVSLGMGDLDWTAAEREATRLASSLHKLSGFPTEVAWASVDHATNARAGDFKRIDVSSPPDHSPIYVLGRMRPHRA
jgi:hypothetical protein